MFVKYMLALSVLACVALHAQQPGIVNADLKTSAASSGLESAIGAIAAANKKPLWIGYAVVATPGEHNSCCWNSGGRGCGLEGQQRFEGAQRETTPVRLEGPSHVAVLLRMEGGEVAKLRVFSIDCPLDAGGLPFHWLTGVQARQSVAMLVGYVNRSGEGGMRSKIAEPALHALSLHGAPDADAVPAIIRIAKEDRSPEVRGKALFWLAQTASRQSEAAITEAVEKDPDTEVKKKAVFALSQLPQNEGVPKLIQVARTHSNPVVKKQAMFWLGQSKDPRALQYFEQLLSR